MPEPLEARTRVEAQSSVMPNVLSVPKLVKHLIGTGVAPYMKALLTVNGFLRRPQGAAARVWIHYE